MRYNSILFCFFLLAITQTFAQIKQDKLTTLFNELAEQDKFNGTVLVAKGDQIVFTKNIGYADFETKTPVTDSTVFELASMGKQFTAMGIMILKERGQLTYEDKITQFLPSLPYEQLSIRHLLTMTSGLPDYLTFADEWDTNEIARNQDIVDFYSARKPELIFTPGDRFEYANINYVLLAEIIAAASRMDFPIFLQEHIFHKAEMWDTRSYSSRFTEKEILPNYAYPYVLSDGKTVRTDLNPTTDYIITGSGIEGDGSIVSTAMDLFTWTMALKENRLVSEATLQEAYTPATLNDGTTSDYGFGMYIGKKNVWHWGGWPGIQTAYTRYLGNDVVAIYMKNVESYDWSWIKKFEKLVDR